MKKGIRRKFQSTFKAKVVLEALKNQQTLAELSKKYDINPTMISNWKAEFLEKMATVFEGNVPKSDNNEMDAKELYAQIGQLKVENDFLKKNCKKLGIEI
jgi:transposase-like protein